MSLQPNAGSQGEYAGLLAIKRYHEARGDVAISASFRHLPTVPNPASAVMVGMKVQKVKCDDQGNIDLLICVHRQRRQGMHWQR